MDGHPARLRDRVSTPPVTFVEAAVGTGGIPSPPVPGPFAAMRQGGVYRTIGSPDFTEPAVWVAAAWVVPPAADVATLAGDAGAGLWIGLDGIDGTQVIQAGVQAVARPGATSGEGTTWVAGAQWWTACADSASLTVENFPVHPGDTVSCTLRVTGPGIAYAMLVNITRGIWTNLAVPRPGDPDGPPEFAPVVLDACADGAGTTILLLAGGGAKGVFVDRGGQPGRHPASSWDVAMTAMEAFA